MAFQLNGQPIYVGKSFVDANGAIYPTNWNRVFTQEQKDEIGIVWVADPEPVDTRFYFDSNTPRRLEDETTVSETGIESISVGLKSNWIKDQKATASGLLAQSDWYVIRKTEAGTEIPADVATYRTAVRTVCAQRETQISEAATFDAFVALVTNQPEVWDETTQTMVANTEPFLTPWPEP